VTTEPAVAVASPYDDPEALIRAARELGRAGATLVVMNCMGYTPAMKALVRDVAGAPVLLPGSLLARFVAEVL
jgi:protein AroM